jgi:hypothetical protein
MMEDKKMENIKPKVYCKYCFEEIPYGFCCRSCFELFECPKPVHGIRMIEED